MQAIVYQLALALAVSLGITTLAQPHRHTQGYMQTLHETQRAGAGYLGAHCDALPGTLTQAALQEAGYLPGNFDGQGATFTWHTAQHPVLSLSVRGNAAYLAFLARRTLGRFDAGGAYRFIPDHDATLFRAANHGYNLFAYAGNDFSCAPL